MKCTTCDNEFEAKRSTAKYCSDVCRVTASRFKGESTEDIIEKIPVPAPEKIKKACCPLCFTFESGIHWCPNRSCGCWQTKEEQEADIVEHQKGCPHPVEQELYSRCMRCGAMIPWVKKEKKALLKLKDTKKK